MSNQHSYGANFAFVREIVRGVRICPYLYPTLRQFQLKALQRMSASNDEKEREWMSGLKKCVVATTAMNDDIGESGGGGGGGGGGCYLVKAASLDLDKNDVGKLKASTKREI